MTGVQTCALPIWLQAARDEFGLSQIICWFDQGSRLAREEVERAMRQFADHVMPKLA